MGILYLNEELNWAGCQGLNSVILAIWEAQIRRTVQGQTRQIVQETPISKITREKWTGGVVKVVECLLCKHEALSSNPSSTKKKKVKLNWSNSFTKFFELRASHLLGMHDTTWATLPAFFCVGYFQDRVSGKYLPQLASNCNLSDLCLLSS
jgi:hypothetical protein